MTKSIKDEAVIQIGGTLITKYRAYEDDLEVVLVIRSDRKFFAAVAYGRQAHRAFRLNDGQAVEIQGPILEYTLPPDKGWSVVYSIACKHMRVGDTIEPSSNPFQDHTELSKFQIFKKCQNFNDDNKSRVTN